MNRTLFPIVASIALLAGCGGVYQPSRDAGFELDKEAEIDDADVQKAYDARPQLPDELHVAYYTFDPETAEDVGETLKAVPSVKSVYRIPPLIVTGQRRFDEPSWGPPKEVGLKKLRLFAARAHADVLVVVDRGWRSGGVNGLAALNILIVPIFCVPFLDNQVESYAEAFVIDVRNGYLYGHLTVDEKNGPKFATIYEGPAKDRADEQWARLRTRLHDDIGKLVVDERAIAAGKKGAPVAPPPI